MGLFSWDCRHCGRAMLSATATESVNSWMSEVVVQFRNGTVLKGEYDGYGRVNGTEMFDFADLHDGIDCAHEACFMAKGGPVYVTGSRHSEDQGWFFDTKDDGYDVTSEQALANPKT